MSYNDTISKNLIKSVEISIGNTRFVDDMNGIVEVLPPLGSEHSTLKGEVKTVGKCYKCQNEIIHSMSISCEGTCYMCWKCLEFQHIVKETELKKGHNAMCKSIIPKCYDNGCIGKRLVQPCYFFNKCKKYTRDCSECLNKVFFGINGYCDGCLTTISN